MLFPLQNRITCSPYYIDLALTSSVSAMIKQSSSYKLLKWNGLENVLDILTGSMRNSATRTMQSKPFEMLMLHYRSIIESLAKPLIGWGLSHFCQISIHQDHEIAFIILGMTATGLVAYKLTKWSELKALDFIKAPHRMAGATFVVRRVPP